MDVAEYKAYKVDKHGHKLTGQEISDEWVKREGFDGYTGRKHAGQPYVRVEKPAGRYDERGGSGASSGADEVSRWMSVKATPENAKKLLAASGWTTDKYGNIMNTGKGVAREEGTTGSNLPSTRKPKGFH